MSEKPFSIKIEMPEILALCGTFLHIFATSGSLAYYMLFLGVAGAIVRAAYNHNYVQEENKRKQQYNDDIK